MGKLIYQRVFVYLIAALKGMKRMFIGFNWDLKCNKSMGEWEHARRLKCRLKRQPEGIEHELDPICSLRIPLGCCAAGHLSAPLLSSPSSPSSPSASNGTCPLRYGDRSSCMVTARKEKVCVRAAPFRPELCWVKLGTTARWRLLSYAGRSSGRLPTVLKPVAGDKRYLGGETGWISPDSIL